MSGGSPLLLAAGCCCVSSRCASTVISTRTARNWPSRAIRAPSESRAMKAAGAPIADDGDALHFCSTCAFSAACIEQGYDKSQLRELHVLVEHIGPFREGE